MPRRQTPSQHWSMPALQGVRLSSLRSVGQLLPEPLQRSGASQVPLRGRQTCIASCTALGGPACPNPSHLSATSQSPAAARQTSPLRYVTTQMPPWHSDGPEQGPSEVSEAQAVPSGALPVSMQTGAPVAHRITAAAHGTPESQGMPSSHGLQLPASSQTPPVHPAPTGARRSEGHSTPPLHDSAGSHAEPALHSPERRTSTGQSALTPSQTSAASQARMEALHTAPAERPAHTPRGTNASGPVSALGPHDAHRWRRRAPMHPPAYRGQHRTHGGFRAR